MNTQKEQIELAKTEFSNVWNVSGKVFKKAASDILKVPIEYIDVRKTVTSDNFGKLSVYHYEDSDCKIYYQLSKGDKEYTNLPSNINEFKKALKEKI